MIQDECGRELSATATAMSVIGIRRDVCGVESAREEVLLGEHHSNTSVYSGTEEGAKEVEHFKRRRVMARWAWAAEISGGNTTAATAMMKGLYAEDHNETLRSIDKELEAQLEVSTEMESRLEGISKELKLTVETTKNGLAQIANELYQTKPSEGQTDMSGVEASLGALTSIAETTKDWLSEIAANVGSIDPSYGQADMSGVEASLDALTNATNHGFKSIVKEIKKF